MTVYEDRLGLFYPRPGDFWVHPTTKLLMQEPFLKRPKINHTVMWEDAVDPSIMFAIWKGNWFFVAERICRSHSMTQTKSYDFRKQQCTTEFKYLGQRYFVLLKQMNRRELKHYGLANVS